MIENSSHNIDNSFGAIKKLKDVHVGSDISLKNHLFG